MGFLMSLIKLTLLFLIISASLLSSTSFAGRQSKFFTKSSAEDFVGVYEDSKLEEDNANEEITVHERMLKRMNTNDYGRYDPSPSLPRPRHKLIPN